MVLLKNFPRQEGAHCASTSLAEIMQYNGYHVSESMAFGISGGLNFLYFNQLYKENSRLVFTRSPMLEYDFFENIGIDFKWNSEEPPSFEEIVNAIDIEKPILCLTNPSTLEFFEVEVPSAGGHTLTIIGYDLEKNTVKISDSISSNILECDYNNLIDSMKFKKPPFYIKNIWKTIEPIEIKESFEHIIFRSLRKNAESMLFAPTPRSGINAIKELGREVKYWSDLPEYKNLCSNVYHSIENIGTGGSGFRNLYAQFLKEIPLYTNDIDINRLVYKKESLAKLYKKLSKNFYLESLGKEKSYVPNIISTLLEIEEKESGFWKYVLETVE